MKDKNKCRISLVNVTKNTSSTMNSSKKNTSTLKENDTFYLKQTNEPSFYFKGTRNIEKYLTRTNSKIRSLDTVSSYLSKSFSRGNFVTANEKNNDSFNLRCKIMIKLR
jgi:hypothetical protein